MQKTNAKSNEKIMGSFEIRNLIKNIIMKQATKRISFNFTTFIKSNYFACKATTIP